MGIFIRGAPCGATTSFASRLNGSVSAVVGRTSMGTTDHRITSTCFDGVAFHDDSIVAG